MDTQFILGLATGVFIGSGYRFLYEYATRNIQGLPDWAKPLRVTDTRAETRIFAATVNASIEPNHIPLMWKSRMRAFLFHAEQCRTPCNARELKERIGLDRPRQMQYIVLLKDAGLIAIPPRGKAVWLTDWTARRKALTTLAYPLNTLPPNFIARAGSTGLSDSPQNTQNTARITA